MERVIQMLTHKVHSVMRGHAVWLKQSQNTEFSCFKKYWNIYGASPPLFPIGSVSLKFFVFFGTASMKFGFEAEHFFYWKSIYSLVTSNTLVIDSRCQANKHLERGGWKDKHALSKYYFKISRVFLIKPHYEFILTFVLYYLKLIFHSLIFSLWFAYNVIPFFCKNINKIKS